MNFASYFHRWRQGSGTTSVFFFSVVFHAALALIAGLWIVAKYIQQAPPKFSAPAKPRILIPAQSKQHRLNLAARQSSAPAPRFQKRLVSLRPSTISLPSVPEGAKMPAITLQDQPSFNSLSQVQGLGGIGSGLHGIGTGLGGTGMGKGAGFQFMGIQTQGQRVYLLFDVSTSVVNKAKKSGTPMRKIKEETLRLLESLPLNARFGLIQFVRNYKPFHESLLPASPQNRELARAWMDAEWNESGQLAKGRKGVFSPEPNGVTAVLEHVLNQQPDVIFLISDGSFQRGSNETISSSELESVIQPALSKKGSKTKIHFIGFEMKTTDREDWERLTQTSGGTLKEIHEVADTLTSTAPAQPRRS